MTEPPTVKVIGELGHEEGDMMCVEVAEYTLRALVLADADSGLGADALARERRRAELDALLAVVGDHGEGRADVELGVVGALGHCDHVGGEDVLLGHGVGEEEQKEMTRQRTVVVLCVKFSDFSFTHGAEPKGIFVHCCI